MEGGISLGTRETSAIWEKDKRPSRHSWNQERATKLIASVAWLGLGCWNPTQVLATRYGYLDDAESPSKRGEEAPHGDLMDPFFCQSGV